MTTRRFAIRAILCAATLAWLCVPSGAGEAPGVTDTEIRVGMSTALTGPALALGQGVKAGVEAQFAEVNAAGGIHGRTLRLVALDDGYEPDRCAPNMRKLTDEENVFAVIGNVGTPTAIVAVPIANEKKTLLFGAFTGAGVLRKTPPDRYVINYRASYAEETATMVNAILDELKLKPEEIGFFTQNDGYGDAGYQGAIQALKTRGYAAAEKLPHGRYTRNTENVEDGLVALLDAPVKPRAVIMVGAYKPCAKFIKLAKDEGLKAVFLNVSFVGSDALDKELGSGGDGVVVTQVVPHPAAGLAAVAAFRETMKKHAPQSPQGFVALEGYLSARIFSEGLKKAGKGLTREGHIDALEAMGEFDIGTSEKLSLGKTDHQASHTVWPTVLRGSEFVPLKWQELRNGRDS